MPKRKYTTVSGYYRKGHRTGEHRRALSDGMMLELAEGSLSQRSTVSRSNAVARTFLLVPDPSGRNRPLYVREDRFNVFSPEMLEILLQKLQPYNSKARVSNVRNYVLNSRRGLRDGETGSETDWVGIVNTVIDVWNEVEGWFGGSSGSGAPSHPGTLVNEAGLIACFFAVGTQLIGFGVHPVNKQIIAFSTPELMKQVFPYLPAGIFNGTFPVPLLPVFPPTPGGAPTSMVQFALGHPDRMIRFKSRGEGYEVVPGAIIPGTDPNGNPVVEPPPPSGGTEGDTTNESKGLGSLVPLALATLLFTR